MTINTHSIMNFSEPFKFQIHPENSVMDIVKELNEALEAHQRMTFLALKSSEQCQDLQSMPQARLTLEQKENSSLERYHFIVSDIFLRLIQEKFSCVLPPETVGYARAISYIEKKILPKDISTFTASELNELLKEIHSCLTNPPKSEFRSFHNLLVFDQRLVSGRCKETFSNLDKYVKCHSTPDQFERWKTSTRIKVWNIGFAKERKWLPLTQEDRKIIKKFAFVCPDASKVSQLMADFTEELSIRLNQNDEPFEMAAWVHKQVTNIHPFLDCNGRVARLLMNMILMRKGHQPILIDNDSSYTEAIRHSDPQRFAEYLRHLSQKQVKSHKFVNQCLAQLFKETCAKHGI